jgi:hypothetical protein
MTSLPFVLTIHHNIRLTRDERYSIHNNVKIIVVGTSIPVWCIGDKTSEPAKEIFCKYYIDNKKQEIPIQIISDGYMINLPNRPAKIPKIIDDERWRQLSVFEKEFYYSRWESEISSQNLLDIKDGGCQSLIYKEQNKIKKDENFINIMHYINIGMIENLES